MARRNSIPWGPRLMVITTYAVLLAFVFLPFLLVFKISLSSDADVQPPYLPWLDLTEGWRNIRDFLQGLSLDNYRELLDEEYIAPLIESLTVAAVSTIVLLLIGFPIAYAIARAPGALQPILIVLVILPFCTSSLIRAYAWKYILLDDGLSLDGLDEHDANAVVAGLCHDLVSDDPGAAVRARADA